MAKNGVYTREKQLPFFFFTYDQVTVMYAKLEKNSHTMHAYAYSLT